jgi:signal transduction histidine kinase
VVLARLSLGRDEDVVLARQLARRVAEQLGFDGSEQTRVATAVSEIARNAFMYGRDGRVEFAIEEQGPTQSLVVRVTDSGPGIADLDNVLAGRYTSRTGSGVGLVGAGRLMGSLAVESAPGGGTKVRLAKALPSGKRLDPPGVERIVALLREARPGSAFEELARQNKELIRAMEELAATSAELALANKELETFSYSVSHDLRAPLRSMAGFSKALLDDWGSKLDGGGRDYLQRIQNASQQMAQLIDDLLVLSRVTRQVMQRKPVDLSALAERVAAGLRETTPERAVEFVIQPGLKAEGDERLLCLALQNLLDNAWKFTSRHETAHIEFATTQADGQQVYYVRDDGAGFDMAYADKLFVPFQRLHSREEFGGTGIGLATAERVIRRHGGRIWGEGAVDKGATFSFTLQP